MPAQSANESPLDRVVRVGIGAALLSMIFFGPHTLWGLVGLVPFLTGLFGFCPLYGLLGLSTCRVSPRAGSDA